MNPNIKRSLCASIITIIALFMSPQPASANSHVSYIANAWAKNTVNAVVFRRNSLVTHKDSQYAAFYNADSTIVLAKRKLGTDKWTTKTTQYKGNTNDAHNSISIMLDGQGFLHMSFDHHGHPLRYCRSIAPHSLELTEKLPMTGNKESNVTYPEFYKMPDGDLIFLYRDGGSGRGDLIINHYDTKNKKWTQLHDVLIDGQNQRNAYWQADIDQQGTIHLSWVWRETGDVATNHDICYAKSSDKGKTWQKTSGQKYNLPINIDTAQYAARIPQKSELMNTTSMCTDSKGNPYIANSWRPTGSKIPQYHVVYHNGKSWNTTQITKRTTPFTLSGGGTKRLPISRPQIIADSTGKTDKAHMIFRDIERQNKVSLATCADLQKNQWTITDISDFSVGQWEPSYDTELWKRSKLLHIFTINVGQGDGEKTENIPPQPVKIIQYKP